MLLLKINNKLQSRFVALIRTKLTASNSSTLSGHIKQNDKIGDIVSNQPSSITAIFNKCMIFDPQSGHQSDQTIRHFYLNAIQQFSTLFHSLANPLHHINHLLTFAQLIRQKNFQIQEPNDSLIQALKKSIQKEKVKQILESLVSSLCRSQNLWLNIRLISLVSFLSAESRQKYLQSVAPFVESMNKYQILTLIVDVERQQLGCDYKLFEKICANKHFRDLDDPKHNYFKFKFFKKFQGKFMHSKISPYAEMLRKIEMKKRYIKKSEELQCLEMIRYCFEYPQNISQWYRMGFIFENNFILRNQRQLSNANQFQQLMHVYQIESVNGNSERLLPTFLAHHHFLKSHILKKNSYFDWFYNMFINVVNYAQPTLKYESNSKEIKDYTNLTVSFIQAFLPTLATTRPEVIFELTPIAPKLFFNTKAHKSLIQIIRAIYKKFMNDKIHFITLFHSSHYLSILEFYLHFSADQQFQIDEITASFFISKFQLHLKQKIACQRQYKLMYQLIRYLQTHNKFDHLLQSYAKIYTNIFERQMMQIVNRESQMFNEFRKRIISSYSKRLIYMALIANHLKKKQFKINNQLLVTFSNKILIRLINSLEYEQIHSALQLYTQLNGINTQIYQCLVSNFSCFMICTRKLYYLNHQYTSIYEQLCRLVLQNKQLFRAITNKQNLKFFQIIFYTINKDKFNTLNLKDFFDVLEDKSYLIKSIAKFVGQKNVMSQKSINNIFIDMYKKIRMNTNYDFQTSFEASQQVATQMDLQKQINQVIHKNLKSDSIKNEFLLTKKSLPRYSKHQLWSKCLINQSSIKIDRDDLSVITPSYLNKIEQNLLLGLSGNQNNIKQILVMYDYNENLDPLLNQVKFNAKDYGALVTVPLSEENLMLISTNRQNYQIMYICAHALTLMGKKVYLVREEDDISKLLAKLKDTYSQKEQMGEPKLEDSISGQDNGQETI